MDYRGLGFRGLGFKDLGCRVSDSGLIIGWARVVSRFV